MKRDEVSKIIPGVTDEQISALLDLNSRDIGAAKAGAGKLQTDLDAANEALKKANETIASLEKNKGDVDALQKEIDAWKQKDADRIAAEQLAAKQAQINERFDKVSGDRKYIHDLVRRGVVEDFAKALEAKENIGKSDMEIFDALTRDKGYFASQNPPLNMGGANSNLGADQQKLDAASDAEYYDALYAKTKA